ncbi:hypothetical protein PR002_g12830 [Phytophthora rubi]|uniref:Uncharacterized protein n=1 Tax=Phytophthora rubi TaxID=129364 RepID=A0A6A3LIZ4_9STRA|nr:hypothetical protein PR002_g12830 [Phytophthora rubi]
MGRTRRAGLRKRPAAGPAPAGLGIWCRSSLLVVSPAATMNTPVGGGVTTAHRSRAQPEGVAAPTVLYHSWCWC